MVKLQAKKNKVSQSMLRKYIRLKETLERVTFEAKKIKEQYDALNEDLVPMFQKKIPVEKGPLVAILDVKKGKRSPSWKNEVVSIVDTFNIAERLGVKNGEEWTEKVIENTPPGSDTFFIRVFRDDS